MFDSSKKGSIEKEKVRTILTTLGHSYDDTELDALLQNEDPEGKKSNNYFVCANIFISESNTCIFFT